MNMSFNSFHSANCVTVVEKAINDRRKTSFRNEASPLKVTVRYGWILRLGLFFRTDTLIVLTCL